MYVHCWSVVAAFYDIKVLPSPIRIVDTYYRYGYDKNGLLWSYSDPGQHTRRTLYDTLKSSKNTT